MGEERKIDEVGSERIRELKRKIVRNTLKEKTTQRDREREKEREARARQS